MKVFYDYQIFQQQIYGGISRYFYELIKGIDADHAHNHKYILPLSSSSNSYIKDIPSIAQNITAGSDYYHQFLNGVEFPGKWRVYQTWSKFFPENALKNQKLTIESLQRESFDLFHPTDVDDYFLRYLKGRPFVITVHDMIDEYFPEYSFHVHSTYKTSVKENLIRKASGIIAVSESTKKNIIDRFDIDGSKIKVIYHGVSDFDRDQTMPDRIVQEKYFLYVGKRTHYKNFYFFLQCIQSLLLDDPSLKVVCAGSPFNKTELDYFLDLGITGNILYIDANDIKLSNLYRHAVAFVYPSLYEGFGMPVLEAFRNGCPIILSNTSSLPEVAGNAGLYFDPKDINSVKTAVYQVLQDERLRQELIRKGFERMKLFSWKKTVEETISFYNTLI
jgi:glycosyltransferase involved in cell wall biosynthesis